MTAPINRLSRIWLCDYGCSRTFCPCCCQRIRPARDKDDRETGLLISRVRRQVDAVKVPWHVYVGQNQGIAIGVDHLGRVVAGIGFIDLKAGVSEHVHHDLTNQIFIFNDQYSVHHRQRVPQLRCRKRASGGNVGVPWTSHVRAGKTQGVGSANLLSQGW